jgi:hypothetical protein
MEHWLMGRLEERRWVVAKSVRGRLLDRASRRWVEGQGL